MSFAANLQRAKFRGLLVYRSWRCARLEAEILAKDYKGKVSPTGGSVDLPSGARVTFGVIAKNEDWLRFIGCEYHHIEFVEPPMSEEIVMKMKTRCRAQGGISLCFIEHPPEPRWRDV